LTEIPEDVARRSVRLVMKIEVEAEIDALSALGPLRAL
jgi:hypothetical protein